MPFVVGLSINEVLKCAQSNLLTNLGYPWGDPAAETRQRSAWKADSVGVDLP